MLGASASDSVVEEADEDDERTMVHATGIVDGVEENVGEGQVGSFPSVDSDRFFHESRARLDSDGLGGSLGDLAEEEKEQMTNPYLN